VESVRLVSARSRSRACTAPPALDIDDSLETLDGVHKASTSFPQGRTKLGYDETKVDLDTVRARIAGLGYKAH